MNMLDTLHQQHRMQLRHHPVYTCMYIYMYMHAHYLAGQTIQQSSLQLV